MIVSQTDAHLVVWNRKRGIAWVSLRLGIAKATVKFTSWFSNMVSIDVVLCHKAASWNKGSTKLERAKKQAKQCKFTWGVNENSLQQRHWSEASLNNNNWEIESAQRESNGRKFEWRVNENMQGKDVQAASETNVFTGTWLPLLRIPFSADHSMGLYQEEHFLGSTGPCGRKSASQRTSEIYVQNDITLKGVSLIWKEPIAYLVFLTSP